MALYSFIQFTSVLILYTVGSTLGDSQFLFVDLFVVTTLAVLIGRVGPHATLGSRRPHGSLLACAVLGSLLGQALLQAAVQLAALLLLRQQAWFTPLDPGGGDDVAKTVASYENTVIFCSSSFQYLIVATALSQGRPFRRPIYTNPAFLLALAVLLVLELWVTLAPPGAIASLMELRPLPSHSFSASLVGLAAINLTVSMLIEALIDSGVLDGCARAVRRKRQPKSRFKREDAALGAQRPPWPPLGTPPEEAPPPAGTPPGGGHGGPGTTPLIVTTLR
ncbi:polyamine-transporting ATPase 13A2-like [Petromyzon marinus]|uniref:Cation-transporting ATPase 13A2-like n=1 Tax=Petromyzon marinus TaxID=7757 RepID=A0AAJ7WJX6_PETMA|nr:cation-transporting ATPase 13A2-like [Petromyzon marinus]